MLNSERDSAALTLRHSRREALFVAGVWCLAFAWTLGYCRTYGYQTAATSTTFGMPTWVCYGIAAPAVACIAITLLFGLFGMSDDDLGAESEAARP